MADQRIKLARKKAGLSLRGLADKMDGLVSAQAIGKYERSEMVPSSEVLIALSKALEVSIPYLLSPQGIELGTVEFRTLSSTSVKDRSRVETEVLEWVERYLQIEEILGLKNGSWSCPIGAPRKLKNLEEAEALANELRAEWKLGTDPIPNMTELLEERGIKVLLADLPEKVSGLTCFVKRPKLGDQTPVIVVNAHKTLERRRFTMAHELGHRLIDASSEGEIEKLCHRFAGAFIMNREHLLKEIGDKRSAFGVREIMDLKRLYRISAAAFLVRLEQVGVLDHGSVQYSFHTFASRWRRAEPEPLDAEKAKSKSESPQRFERLVYRAAAEDMISLSKAVELLRVPLGDVEKGLKGPSERHADHR